jgi:hypothetical protein
MSLKRGLWAPRHGPGAWHGVREPEVWYLPATQGQAGTSALWRGGGMALEAGMAMHVVPGVWEAGMAFRDGPRGWMAPRDGPPSRLGWPCMWRQGLGGAGGEGEGSSHGASTHPNHQAREGRCPMGRDGHAGGGLGGGQGFCGQSLNDVSGQTPSASSGETSVMMTYDGADGPSRGRRARERIPGG